MNKYEFEIVNFGDGYWHESTLATMSGLPFAEVHAAVKATGRDRWGGQLYVITFQSLGFNTNPRFVKFDPSTSLPCILRCRNHVKGYWYVFYYNAGVVYDCVGNSFLLNDHGEVTLRNGSYFLKCYGMKVTSMLQVWV
ncbi:hypothetical protein [Sphingobacterium suaedae]|uniref:Uncharacterized protein n=1 Tax=Sphingobacterium suaedae TaxID=1686402 RepID=A0ABW5KIV4_9SPHI